MNINMEKKQIKINPDFFSLSKRKRKHKAKKPEFKHSLRTKDIKKNLLKRIKDHQKRNEEKKETPVTVQEPSIDQQFTQSVEYLNSIQQKKKQKKKEKKSKPVANTVQIDNQIKIDTSTQSTNQAKTRKNNSLIRPDPPYGVLKTGKKPLYRDYMNTLRDKVPSLVIHEDKNKIDKPIEQNVVERQHKLKKLVKKYKVRKRRFTLGKDKKNGKIGVLIKNRTMKKKIQKDLEDLKDAPLFGIKKYLRRHGLLRIGTPAPENIVRNIYQDSKSAGEIYNISTDVMLHNYLNEAI